MTGKPRKPRSESPGATLRAAVTTRYELEAHELALLDSAAHTADLVADLQARVDTEGTMLEGRVHPALVELRQQRLTLGRLLAGLKIPTEDDRPGQHRGPRGFYGPRGVAG